MIAKFLNRLSNAGVRERKGNWNKGGLEACVDRGEGSKEKVLISAFFRKEF